MCESNLTVIDFDKIPNEYGKRKKISSPKSNDALYIDDNNNWYFIEFKNGQIEKGEIYRKIYDSLIMLIEMNIAPNFDFFRSHAQYILVYNSKKSANAPLSEARNFIYNNITNLAQQETKLFEVEKFEKYLFYETHTYAQELFQERFVAVMEKAEGLQK